MVTKTLVTNSGNMVECSTERAMDEVLLRWSFLPLFVQAGNLKELYLLEQASEISYPQGCVSS